MGDDLDDAIRTNAEGPASASDETGGVTQHTLAGMSTAERPPRRLFIPHLVTRHVTGSAGQTRAMHGVARWLQRRGAAV